jgi:hypothetical protein
MTYVDLIPSVARQFMESSSLSYTIRLVHTLFCALINCALYRSVYETKGTPGGPVFTVQEISSKFK